MKRSTSKTMQRARQTRDNLRLQHLELPKVDDLEEDTSPPLPGKQNPRQEMGNCIPAFDDEVRNGHHHPNESAVIEFDVDPDAADAAADLASDLGSEFLEGATRCVDVSELAMPEENPLTAEVPFIFQERGLEGVEARKVRKKRPTRAILRRRRWKATRPERSAKEPTRRF